MLGDIVDVLSLWEIAHRWHDYDPNRTDPEALPLEVQDTLRVLTKQMWRHALPSFSAAGVERRTHETVPSFSEWLAGMGLDPALCDGAALPAVADPDDEAEYLPEGGKMPLAASNVQQLRERYNEAVDAQVRPHSEAVEGFEAVFRARRYDREKLEAVFLARLALKAFCEEHALDLPTFWFSADERKRGGTAKEPALRNNQIDKLLCQAVARTLWEASPTMPIKHIIEHKAIQRYANGAQYAEKTLHSWVSEVDPRPDEAKVGRPRKDAGASDSQG